jgi:hypothetical protein
MKAHRSVGTAVGSMAIFLVLAGGAGAGAVGVGGKSQHSNPPGGIGDGFSSAILYLLPPAPGSGTNGNEIESGDRIQLFDVKGLDITSAMTITGGPFTFSSALTGPLPASTSFTDDPTIPNLTLTYGGPTLTVATGAPQIEIGAFSYMTHGAPFEPGFNFAAETTELLSSGGTQNVVTYGFATFTLVPEPSSLLLLLVGLPGIVWIGSRRRSA